MRIYLLGILSLITITSCQTSSEEKTETKWKGQAPVQAVPTDTKPIQKQLKTTFHLGNGVYASNNFDGARLNGITRINDTLVEALITPENTPINPSPWYAFKIWSKNPTKLTLKLTYQYGVNHRYPPKVSKDRKNWKAVDKDSYQLLGMDSLQNPRTAKAAQFKISVSSDTIWVAAQEIMTSTDNRKWIDNIASKPFVYTRSIGTSKEQRTMTALEIGPSTNKQAIAVISRQHPPEVTGYIAMKSFVETIASESDLAKKFRQKFSAYVVPMVNPDGVDNGHWRHNAGGVDLNRDWSNKNQTEINVVQNYFKRVTDADKKIYFFVDFHSTYEDIFYTLNPKLPSNATSVVPKMIERTGKELGLDPNIKPFENTNSVISSRYFYNTYNAESLTYEIGDNTPRELLKQKGKTSAIKLMELLLNEH